MKYRNFVFVIVVLSFLSCNDDSITEPILKNYMTLSGDISATFETYALAGVMANAPFVSDIDSASTFVLFIHPQNSFSPSEEIEMNNTFSFMKFNSGILDIGVYTLNNNSLFSNNDFMCSFFVNDTTFYSINSGNIEITNSSANFIEGHINVTGYYLGFPIDSTRALYINAEFSSILEDI
jgi:hypothetical protein